jgi:hypothetical protein
VLKETCYHDCELGVSADGNCAKMMERTSSHSASTVSNAIMISDTPNRRARLATLSTKRSAPYTRRKTPETRAKLWKAMLSQSITACMPLHVGFIVVGEWSNHGGAEVAIEQRLRLFEIKSFRESSKLLTIMHVSHPCRPASSRLLILTRPHIFKLLSLKG